MSITLNGAGIIAIAGLPGAGKTRFANILSRQIGARIVSRDDLFAIHGMHLEIEEGKNKAWNLVLKDVNEHVNQSCSGWLIVEGTPFGKKEQIEELELSAGTSQKVHWLWLDCPVDVCKQRIAGQDDHSAPDRTPILVDIVASRFMPPPKAIRLDGQLPTEVLVGQAVKLLASQSGLTKPWSG